MDVFAWVLCAKQRLCHFKKKKHQADRRVITQIERGSNGLSAAESVSDFSYGHGGSKMVLSMTCIWRISDGLALASSMDDDPVPPFDVFVLLTPRRSMADSVAQAEMRDVRDQIKQLTKRLSVESDPRGSLESGPYVFQFGV